MGDVSPIILKQKSSVWVIILSEIVFLLVAGFILFRISKVSSIKIDNQK